LCWRWRSWDKQPQNVPGQGQDRMAHKGSLVSDNVKLLQIHTDIQHTHTHLFGIAWYRDRKMWYLFSPIMMVVADTLRKKIRKKHNEFFELKLYITMRAFSNKDSKTQGKHFMF
jgi:hypothetical protein